MDVNDFTNGNPIVKTICLKTHFKLTIQLYDEALLYVKENEDQYKNFLRDIREKCNYSKEQLKNASISEIVYKQSLDIQELKKMVECLTKTSSDDKGGNENKLPRSKYCNSANIIDISKAFKEDITEESNS